MLDLLDGLIDVYTNLMIENPGRKNELTNQLYMYTNSQKAYQGMLNGLRNPVLMQKKKDFEEKFKNAVKAKPELNTLYGNLWKEIAENRHELRGIANEQFALSLAINPVKTTEYFNLAQELIELAKELKLPEEQRSEYYKGSELDTTVDQIFPEDFDSGKQIACLKNNSCLW